MTRVDGSLRGLALASVALLLGCSRGCGTSASVPVSVPDAAKASLGPARFSRDRCVAEIQSAAVGVPAGSGPIHALLATCVSDGEAQRLSVWTTRGTTLSRLTRSTAQRSSFLPAQVLSEGAVEPSTLDERTVVWRALNLGEEDDRDEWWAGQFDPSTGDIHIGSVLLTAGWKPAGMIVPLSATTHGVDVLTALFNPTPGDEHNPTLAHRVIAFDNDAPLRALDADVEESDDAGMGEAPLLLVEGELRGWEPEHRVALSFAMNEDDKPVLRGTRMGTGSDVRPEPWGELPLTSQSVMVAPRGVAVGDESWFVVSEFSFVHQGDSQDCVVLQGEHCAHAGALQLVRVSKGKTPVTLTLAPSGLGDVIAVDDQRRALVMFIAADRKGAAPGVQKLLRANPATGAIEPLDLTGAGGLPPFDHPTITRCGDSLWFAAEVRVQDERASGGLDAFDPTGIPSGGDVAVIAAPLECLTTH